MRGEGLAGLRVLVLDDEAMLAMLVDDMLAELSCVVIGPAAAADEALALLAGEAVDAALIDVNLRSGQSGYSVARQLAAHRVPFAFVTAYGVADLDPAFRDRPRLQKPFQKGALMRTVAALAASLTPAPRDAASTADVASFLPTA